VPAHPSTPEAPSLEPPTRMVAFVTVATFLGYMLLWWNQYFAPNNGGEISLMNEYLHGQLPYRDYYAHQPPGVLLVVFALARTFGVRSLPFYVLGLLVRSAAVGALYALLAKRRTAVVAGFACVVAAITSCADDGDGVAHYNHWSQAFVVFGTLATHRCLAEKELATRKLAIRGMISGICWGSTFALKQTTGTVGVAIVLGFCAFVLVRRRDPAARIVLFLGSTFLGWALVVGGCLLWLASNGILDAFLHCVFVVAPSAKGGVITSLLRPITFIPILATFRQGLGLAVILAASAAIALGLGSRSGRTRSPTLVAACSVSVAVGVAIAIGREAAKSSDVFRRPLTALIYVAFIGCLILAIMNVARLWRRPDDPDALHGGLVSAMGFATAYAMAISWPAFESMLFPALAVALTEIDFELARTRFLGEARTGAFCILMCVVALAAMRRFDRPFSWAYWREPPVSKSTVASVQPALAGIEMSESTERFLDGATALIRANSDPDDAVLAFPHLWTLTGLAERRTFGFVPVYWFDTCPDVLARADAALLLEHPPQVIVSMDLPEAFFADQEVFFRHGAPSGQRDLYAAMHTVIERDHYVELAKFDFTRNPSVRIWARPRPGSTEPRKAGTINGDEP